MPISADFTSVFSKDFVIDFTQCYPNGFLKYTELCNVLQLAAADHAEKGGISFTDMQQAHQAWVVSRMRIEIVALPKWRDVVTVKTWIVSLENSRSVRALEMYCNGKKIVGCETFWAVFNTQTRRPEALALPYEHFTIYNNVFSTAERVRKVAVADAGNIVSKRSVMLSDLDIVNHANNVKYLEWCLDLLDPNVVLRQRIHTLDMNFMKELMLHDKVEIAGNEAASYSVIKDGKPCFTMELGIS
ncbi:MAG TPA: acyl-ACP thioesterase domain-containing protein [Flavobacterium sp.]